MDNMNDNNDNNDVVFIVKKKKFFFVRRETPTEWYIRMMNIKITNYCGKTAGSAPEANRISTISR